MSRKPQIAIIGMGTFGQETAKSLMAQSIPVCAVDTDEAVIESLRDQVTASLVLDSTQEEALKEAELDSMDLVVVAIGAGRVEASIMTTSLLKQLGVKTVIARATSDLHGRILKQVGADSIINPERDMGERVARRIAQPSLQDIVTLPDGTQIARVPVPGTFVGHTLLELDVRRRYNLMVLGIERPQAAPQKKKGKEQKTRYDVDFGLGAPSENCQVIMNPDPAAEKMQAGDSLLVMGKRENVDILAEAVG